jgi:Ca-activated chloride channel family protein
MNRTTLLLAAAAVLTLVALVSGPRPPGHGSANAPVPSASPRAKGVAGSNTLSFTAAATDGLLATQGGEAWAVVDVQAAERHVADQRVSLAIALDVSGSMSGGKLEQAKLAARRLVERLGDGDELALVAFSDGARTLPLARMDEGGRAAALLWIDGLGTEGATNIGAGLEAAEAALLAGTGAGRIVLVSDGKATVGLVTRPALEARALEAHARGLTLTAIGVGTDFDPGLMRGMAQSGGGFYGDLRQPEALEVVLAQELSQARAPLARNVTLTFQPGDAAVVSAAGRTLRQGGDGATVWLPDLGSGASARVLVKLRVPSGTSAVALLRPKLAWTNADGTREAAEATVTVARSWDADEVRRSRDEVLYADVARAFGNEQLVLASEALERGDRAAAFGLLDRARAMFGTSADALAGEDQVVSETKQRWESGNYDAKRESKDMMKKTLSTFGEKNAYAY